MTGRMLLFFIIGCELRTVVVLSAAYEGLSDALESRAWSDAALTFLFIIVLVPAGPLTLVHPSQTLAQRAVWKLVVLHSRLWPSNDVASLFGTATKSPS
jgi:hypothetical protein